MELCTAAVLDLSLPCSLHASLPCSPVWLALSTPVCLALHASLPLLHYCTPLLEHTCANDLLQHLQGATSPSCRATRHHATRHTAGGLTRLSNTWLDTWGTWRHMPHKTRVTCHTRHAQQHAPLATTCNNTPLETAHRHLFNTKHVIFSTRNTCVANHLHHVIFSTRNTCVANHVSNR